MTSTKTYTGKKKISELFAFFPCKMAFFKRMWWKVKVLSCPWAVGSKLPLFRPLKWGTKRLRTLSGSKNMSRQKIFDFHNWTLFFHVFNFDGLYFWNHWELRDVMYLILKVLSVVIWSQQLKGMTSLLASTTPYWKKRFVWKTVLIFFRLSDVCLLVWVDTFHKGRKVGVPLEILPNVLGLALVRPPTRSYQWNSDTCLG